MTQDKLSPKYSGRFMIDGTIVKVHRHGQGAKGGPIHRQLENPEVE